MSELTGSHSAERSLAVEALVEEGQLDRRARGSFTVAGASMLLVSMVVYPLVALGILGGAFFGLGAMLSAAGGGFLLGASFGLKRGAMVVDEVAAMTGGARSESSRPE